MSPMPFDQDVAELLLRYAKRIVARGYVHNYRHAESVIYPSRDATRRPAGGDRLA
jgi:hypothetical protein